MRLNVLFDDFVMVFQVIHSVGCLAVIHAGIILPRQPWSTRPARAATPFHRLAARPVLTTSVVLKRPALKAGVSTLFTDNEREANVETWRLMNNKSQAKSLAKKPRHS